jgi:amino acid transporter
MFIFRMAYAFSRDGAMPLSSLWHKVNNQEVPINAVWLSVVISFCMALTVFSFHHFQFAIFAVLSEFHFKNLIAITLWSLSLNYIQ